MGRALRLDGDYSSFQGVDNMLSVQKKETKILSKKPDFSTGLESTAMFDWMPGSAMDSDEILPSVEENIPVDGEEIVKWMQECTADIALLNAYAGEYNIYSRVVRDSGDGFIPGVSTSGVNIQGERGSYVNERGYAVCNTPRGSFRVPAGWKARYAFNDVLAWAAVPSVFYTQIRAIVMRWLDLAKTPINSRIRFVSTRGRVAPNFFKVSSKVPTPLLTMRIGLTSSDDQKVKAIGRGLEGSYQDVMFEDEFDVPEGATDTLYMVSGFPVVSAFTLELQPEDRRKTVLDYLQTIP